MENKNKYFDFYAPVFYPTVLVIGFFIILSLALPTHFETYLKQLHHQICDNFGSLIMLTVNFFLCFCLFCAFSRFGNIKIGGKNAQVEFSSFAWFAMLFTAGIGSGALFFSVAEPISHYANPPVEVASNTEAAANAMKWALLHHGVHGWAIYTTVGLVLAFFTFNRNLPLTISATFRPLLGKLSEGFLGHLVDIITVTANLFGVSLSLVIATQLLSNGLNQVIGLPDTIAVQLIILSLITIGATVSVILGLKKGVRVLSEINIRLAIVLLLGMLFIGPTVFILDSFVENTGAYLQNFIELSTWTEAYRSQNWQNSWTLFYWIWWMAWAPFVGIFIARISRGRTIREFVVSSVFLPCLAMFIWYAVFGSAALHIELQGIGSLAENVQNNAASGFFTMLTYYPYSQVTSIVFLILAAIFFITSSDSASLVNDMITNGGKLESPKGQRIFWAVTEGVVAAILLSFGGYGVIKGVVTIFGFAFMFVLVGMTWSFYKELSKYLN